METENYPVLYVIVRNDIPSMNPGKAEAHSGHAASKFVYDAMKGKSKPGNSRFKKWVEAADGFGTQINLNGSIEDIICIEDYLDDVNSFHVPHDIETARVVDPTYPFFCPITGDLKLRNECTAFYIFGMKDDPVLIKATQHMKLKP